MLIGIRISHVKSVSLVLKIDSFGHIKFCFPYILSLGYRIFKMLVSTPHNTPLIMGDRNKNFEDSITQTRDIRKIIFDLFNPICSPFITKQQHLAYFFQNNFSSKIISKLFETGFRAYLAYVII
jgi:hypothetical protein